ncbi:UNVERIFIED_CONTAM: hypothetical protein FKN15_066373 [Acipenser sinensis]
MNTRCPPKHVPSAAHFFTLCRLTMQPPQSYSVGGQRSSGQLTGKPAGARPDYRGRWCAVSRGHPGRPNPPSPRTTLGQLAPPPWEIPSTVGCGIAWIGTRDIQAIERILHSSECFYWMRHSGAPDHSFLLVKGKKDMPLESEVVLTKMKILMNNFQAEFVSPEESLANNSIAESDIPSESLEEPHSPPGQTQNTSGYLTPYSDLSTENSKCSRLSKLFKFESEDSGVELPSGANSPSTPTSSEKSFVVHSRGSSCDSGDLSTSPAVMDHIFLLSKCPEIEEIDNSVQQTVREKDMVESNEPLPSGVWKKDMPLESEVVLTKMKILMNNFQAEFVSPDESLANDSIAESDIPSESLEEPHSPPGQTQNTPGYLTPYSDLSTENSKCSRLSKLFKFESEDSGVELPSGANSPSTPTSSEKSFVVHSRGSSCDSGDLSTSPAVMDHIFLLSKRPEMKEIDNSVQQIVREKDMVESNEPSSAENTPTDFTECQKTGGSFFNHSHENIVEETDKDVEEASRLEVPTEIPIDDTRRVSSGFREAFDDMTKGDLEEQRLQKYSTSDSLDEYMDECCRLSEAPVPRLSSIALNPNLVHPHRCLILPGIDLTHHCEDWGEERTLCSGKDETQQAAQCISVSHEIKELARQSAEAFKLIPPADPTLVQESVFSHILSQVQCKAVPLILDVMKELQTSWKNPASTRAVSHAVEVLYPLDEADKVHQGKVKALGSGLGYLEHICQLIEKIGQLQEHNLKLQKQICSLQKESRTKQMKEEYFLQHCSCGAAALAFQELKRHSIHRSEFHNLTLSNSTLSDLSTIPEIARRPDRLRKKGTDSQAEPGHNPLAPVLRRSQRSWVETAQCDSEQALTSTLPQTQPMRGSENHHWGKVKDLVKKTKLRNQSRLGLSSNALKRSCPQLYR